MIQDERVDYVVGLSIRMKETAACVVARPSKVIVADQQLIPPHSRGNILVGDVQVLLRDSKA